MVRYNGSLVLIELIKRGELINSSMGNMDWLWPWLNRVSAGMFGPRATDILNIMLDKIGRQPLRMILGKELVKWKHTGYCF